jgi:hypothetical protein
MTPETPKEPRKPRKASKTETAKAKKAVEKLVTNAQTELKKHSIGRPSSYDPVIAQQICELLSEGVPLRVICRMEGMPAWRNVYFWMARDPDLSAHIARAREVGYDAIAEECLQIADTPQMGQKQTMSDEGSTTTIEDMLGHRKLQIETRLKLLAKWRPEKYGDKTVITGDPNGAPIKTEETGSGRLFELIRNMEMNKRVTE